ncbi:MAG TPA: xanthine dehydrogenase family protein molybdopterin-binding subunit [Actinophytocola sp.]|uniref:xanthine dehydrogenase family protein molybdopterin-binding subunit n=1 Tax=Actinophytocola sp. TaxID=1872138 RepID=UPI002DBEA92D|nr:xanthine dehydrogenase family protein molybdopterin-binding subunit [Actinophytocola sp.]HEU5471348.1 xanthine dehydrogenase family protein molybdopterin-binding subunit [Actinophytocola sp.]
MEDPRFLLGQGRYVDNLDLQGAVRVVFLRSSMAHARIRSLDLTAARRAPGVLAVVATGDVEPATAPPTPGLPEAMVRPLLARGVVRYVGEPVAAVVAETAAQAVDALELIDVEYDPLPVVADVRAAIADETLLFPEHGTNVAIRMDPADGAAGEFFADCPVVVRLHLAGQRLVPAPMEVRAAAATWDGPRLTVWASTQVPHRLRDDLVALYGLPADEVRVVSPDVGGGFGAKASGFTEYYLLAALARIAGRPARWVETRSENILGMVHGRAQSADIELGGTRDGRLLAARLSIVQDAGAYPMFGALLPQLTIQMGPGIYDLRRFSGSAVSVVTNTVPIGAYRGAGRPEATYAIERAVDAFAAEIGMDPVRLRRQNLVASDAFPYTTATGQVYDSGAYQEVLDRAETVSGYAGLRAEQQRRRAAGTPNLLGIGVSGYVEITNAGGMGDAATVEVDDAGRAVIRAGTHSHGQGHATAYAMIVAEVLGIPVEHTTFVQGDTDEVPTGIGTFGSRSLQTSGAAVELAAQEVLSQARELAADLLEVAAADVELRRDPVAFRVVGVPGVGADWAAVARHADDRGTRLRSDITFEPGASSFPFGFHVAVVEVDAETGRVRPVRMVAVDDCGRVLNPLLVEGQVHGGLAQGIAQALFEDMVYDEAGNPLTVALAEYGMPAANDLPPFELHTSQTPTPLNALGAKGIGESGTIGSIAAMANAVVDALSEFGVRHLDLPATPQRVWAAIRQALLDRGSVHAAQDPVHDPNRKAAGE